MPGAKSCIEENGGYCIIGTGTDKPKCVGGCKQRKMEGVVEDTKNPDCFNLLSAHVVGTPMKRAGQVPTGSLDKPNLIRDALQEFPYAQYALAGLTREALKKYKSRDWREKDLAYFTGKVGRHIARAEIDGEVNKDEGNQLHMVAAAWSLMAYVDTMLRRLSESNGGMEPYELLKAIKDGSVKP